MTETTSKRTELDQIVEAIAARRRFVISSHSRPDGDSIAGQDRIERLLHDLQPGGDATNPDDGHHDD